MRGNAIPRCFVEDALACVHRRGLSVAPLLSAAGLADPVSEYVTVERYGALWLAIARALDDEFFSLGMRPMPLGSFDLLCRCVLHAETLDHVLRDALRFLRIVLGEPYGRLILQDGRALIRVKENSDPRSAFAYRTFWIILHGVMCWMTGRRIPLLDMSFRCPSPSTGGSYATFFGVGVRFSQAETEMTFDAKLLSLPTVRDKGALRDFLRGAPANILVRYRQDIGMSAVVRSALQSLPFTRWPTFDGLAETLGTPPATLRRRLSREGQSYQAIKDELRRVEALKLLVRKDKSIAQVAAELGFAEPSAFHRAFGRWTSQRPGSSR